MDVATALYGGDDGFKQQAAAFGFSPEMIQAQQPNDIEVWPENWDAVMLFIDMGTQWNAGLNGRTGLRYETLPVMFRLRGIARADQRRVFDQLRTLERAALDAGS